MYSWANVHLYRKMKGIQCDRWDCWNKGCVEDDGEFANYMMSYLVWSKWWRIGPNPSRQFLEFQYCIERSSNELSIGLINGLRTWLSYTRCMYLEYIICKHEKIWSTSNDDVTPYEGIRLWRPRKSWLLWEPWRRFNVTSYGIFSISYGRVCYHLRKKNHRQLSTALCHFVR